MVTLKKNFSWNLMANIIYSLSQWGIVTSLAKIGNATMVGQFTLALAITAPIILFFNLQMRNVFITDVNSEYTFNQYFSIRLLTNLVALIFIFIISNILYYKDSFILIIIIITFAKIFDGFSDIIHAYFQKEERMDIPSKSKIYKGTLLFIIVITITFLTENIFGIVIGYFIGYVFIFFVYDYRLLKLSNKLKFQFEGNFNLMKIALPLGLTVLCSSLYVNFPKIILEKYLDAEKLGYFTAIAYLISIGGTFIGALGLTIVPRLSKLYQNKEFKKFIKLLFLSSIFAAGVGGFLLILSISVGEQLLGLIYTYDYSNYNDIFIILSIGSIFMFVGTFMGYGLTATKSFKIQPILSLLSLISCVFLSITLIPYMGIRGAAYVVMLASIIQFLLQFIYLYLRIRKERKNEVSVYNG